jgi:hypothetical protein
LAFRRTPARLFNRPFFRLHWDGLALRMVLGYALRATSKLRFTVAAHDGLAGTSLDGCPCLADTWPHTGVLGVEKCSPGDMPADSKSQSA